jgi:hypothetical protein
MSVTPGVVCRSRAISSVTLCPGIWPPSPGLEPWAILICSTSAFARYWGVTPKRPDATCFMRQSRSRALPRVAKRCGLSPPSPELALPPMRFIAAARVSCASADRAPCDIAPVENRLAISWAGSTSSIGTGEPAATGSRKSRG